MQTNEGLIAAGVWNGCDYSSYFRASNDSHVSVTQPQEMEIINE